VIRLGIRVRPADAEAALAALLPVLGGGAEERAVDGAVEYALYGPAGELPGEAELRALAGGALVGVRAEPVPDGWQTRWHAFLRPVRVGSLTVRPPWVTGGAGDLVIDPGPCFGAGTHPTTRLCLALLLDAAPGGALCDWGAGTGILAVAAALDRPPARLIASGLLAAEAAAVADAFAARGMRETDRRTQDGWAALVLEAA
jgi:ribosomal protein L11 methyltransferase